MGALYNNGWQCRGFAMGANTVGASIAKAVDTTTGNGFSIQLEVLTGYAAATTVEFWACPALAGSNGCAPDLANAYQITEIELCDITGQTLVVDAINVPANAIPGSIVWARPRCLNEKFIAIKGTAGDFAHLSPVAVFDRLT